MLPTPETDHVPFDRVYEPAEDSYLLLDTLSAPTCTSWLSSQFPPQTPCPLVVEIGTGSGVVLAFITAHAQHIFGRSDVLSLGVDINPHATHATQTTVSLACEGERSEGKAPGQYLGNSIGDLTTPLKDGSVDVLVFNPPYVPTDDLPTAPLPESSTLSRDERYALDSKLLALSYAGGKEGMEVTERLLAELPRVLSRRGCAYVLLCHQNRPEEIKERIRQWGAEGEWEVETVGASGKKAGWEKLCIVRIWRSCLR